MARRREVRRDREPRRVRRSQRPLYEALDELGCTCEPDFYVVDDNTLRIEHQADHCLLIISGVRRVDWPDQDDQDRWLYPPPPAPEWGT
jgi:hypothetical protein